MNHNKLYSFGDKIIIDYNMNENDRLIYNLSDELMMNIPEIFYEYLLYIPVEKSEVTYEFMMKDENIYLFKDVANNKDKYAFVYKIHKSGPLQLYKSNMIDYGNRESYNRIKYTLIGEGDLNKGVVRDLPLIVKTTITPVGNLKFPKDFSLFTNTCRTVSLEVCNINDFITFKKATYINNVCMIEGEISNGNLTHKLKYDTIDEYNNLTYVMNHTIYKSSTNFLSRKYYTLIDVLKDINTGRTYLNDSGTKIGYDKYYNELMEYYIMKGYSSYKGEFQTNFNLEPEPYIVSRRKYTNSFISEIIMYHENGAIKRYGNDIMELHFDRFGNIIPDMSSNHGLNFIYDDSGKIVPDYGFRRKNFKNN